MEAPATHWPTGKGAWRAMPVQSALWYIEKVITAEADAPHVPHVAGQRSLKVVMPAAGAVQLMPGAESTICADQVAMS